MLNRLELTFYWTKTNLDMLLKVEELLQTHLQLWVVNA